MSHGHVVGVGEQWWCQLGPAQSQRAWRQYCRSRPRVVAQDTPDSESTAAASGCHAIGSDCTATGPYLIICLFFLLEDGQPAAGTGPPINSRDSFLSHGLCKYVYVCMQAVVADVNICANALDHGVGDTMFSNAIV